MFFRLHFGVATQLCVYSKEGGGQKVSGVKLYGRIYETKTCDYNSVNNHRNINE